MPVCPVDAESRATALNLIGSPHSRLGLKRGSECQRMVDPARPVSITAMT